MANSYLDQLEAELNSQGVASPLSSSAIKNVGSPDDIGLKTILEMEQITGVTYSDEQKDILKHKGNACILACAGSGKALVNGTGVLTPSGYRPIETLKVGDKVFDENGYIQEVLGVYPQGKKQVNIVRFSDNNVIKCCSEHLWGARKEDSTYWGVFNTKQIKKVLETDSRVEVPKVNGDLDDFFWDDNREVYLSVLRNKLPSTLEICNLLDENDIDYSEAYDGDDSAKLMHSLMCKISARYSFKNAQLLYVFQMCADFFGYGLDTEYKDGQYEIKVTFDFRYITSVEETEEYEEMTCIKVTGLSELFLTEHCIVTHNTTVTTHLIAKRIKTGEIPDVNKLIYATYSKAGADEMNERLNALLSKLKIDKTVKVRTLHAFFLQVLRTFGVTANIIKGERIQFVKEACRDAEFQPKDDELMLIDNLLSYQVNNLLSDKKTIDCYVNTIEELTVEQYSKIRAGYASRKAAKGLIDYDDMQSYLYLWLVKFAKSSNAQEVETSRQVREYCQAMWTDFYIDEAQDVSKIQFAIIRGIVTNPDDPNKLVKNLVFIGDDDQCIYTWRGSDPSIILSIGPTFDMRTFVLSTNYRCKNEIVDYATTGIKCNSNRYNKGMSAFTQGGKVKILPSEREDLCSLSILAMTQIKWWLQQGDSPKDIAVLSRNNFHLALLSNMLLREGIYCNLTEDMKLTKSSMYKDIRILIDFCEPNWKHEQTATILWRLCRFMGVGTARIIANFQNTCALSIQDTLGWLVKRFIDKEINFSKKLNINIQAEEKIMYYMNRMSKDTQCDLENVYLALASGNRDECLKTLMYAYIAGTEFMYRSKDKNRSIQGLVLYINNLIRKDGFDKMIEFLRVTEQFENGRMGTIGDKVTLTTIHSAKGREWKNVIMFACDNISEPSFDGIYKMLEDGIDIADIYQYLDEERRLFYVGNTRAKENLLALTYAAPSIFMLESLGASIGSGISNNARIIELVQNQNVAEVYKDTIQSNIFDKDSKYFYNKDDYIVK